MSTGIATPSLVRKTFREIAIKHIKVDHDIQSRVKTDPAHVKHLSDMIHLGTTLTEPVVFHDEDTGEFILADGFHRVAAYRKLGTKAIRCEIIKGSRRDAIFYSTHANVEHGSTLTDDDKRKSVRMLLADEEWRSLSLIEIARRVGFKSSNTVKMIRAEYFAEHGIKDSDTITYTYTGRNGTGHTVTRKPPEIRPTTPRMRAIKRNGPKDQGGVGVAYVAAIPRQKPIYLGSDKEVAETRFAEIAQSFQEKKPILAPLRDNMKSREWFVRRGVPLLPRATGGVWSIDIFPDFHSKTDVIAIAAPHHASLLSTSPIALAHAFGRLAIFRQAQPDDRRFLIVCYYDDVCNATIDLIRANGISVMTPEEFVADLKSSGD